MAAQETFFNYGDSLSSKRLCETFGITSGVGPISGFGSAKVVDSGGIKQLVVYPYASGDENSISAKEENVDQLRHVVRSKINSHRTTSSSTGEEPMQSLIARDGTILRLGQGSITVPIEGTESNEVFLFAHHEHIPEKVDNPVTLVAIFNNSPYDFYSIYRESRDPYYPTGDLYKWYNTSSNDNIPVVKDKVSFSSLEDTVMRAYPEFAKNKNSMVLVGIYGTGVNEVNNKLEPFAIVPYQGSVMGEAPYTLFTHNLFKNSIKSLMNFIYSGISNTKSSYHNLSELIQELTRSSLKAINNRIDDLNKYIEETLKSLISVPIGSVTMYAGSTTPNGYMVCDGRYLSIKDYPKLYAVLGNKYNEAVSSEGKPYNTAEGYFRLPDLKGRFIVGVKDSLPDYNLGSTGGEEKHTLNVQEIPSHSHIYADDTKADGNSFPVPKALEEEGINEAGGNFTATRQYEGLRTSSAKNEGNGTIYLTGKTGNGQAHENRPPYYTLYYIIKVE
jgi:microcystin-dependent protein